MTTFKMTKAEAVEFLEQRGGLDNIIRLLLDRRNATDVAEYDFLFAIHAYEVSELWRTQSPGTFDQTLTRHHLCAPERFSRWKRAVRELGENTVKEIGVKGATQAVRLEDRGKRKRAVDDMRATVQREGTVVSERTARTIVSNLMPPIPAPKRFKTLEDLKRENMTLEQRVEELETENARLKDENARLQKRLAKSERLSGNGSAPRKRSKKTSRKSKGGRPARKPSGKRTESHPS